MIAQTCVCVHSKRVYYASTASVWFVRDGGGGRQQAHTLQIIDLE